MVGRLTEIETIACQVKSGIYFRDPKIGQYYRKHRGERERETESERQRQTDRDRQTETERQTDRQRTFDRSHNKIKHGYQPKYQLEIIGTTESRLMHTSIPADYSRLRTPGRLIRESAFGVRRMPGIHCSDRATYWPTVLPSVSATARDVIVAKT